MFFISSFFFNDTATTEIYTLSLHDALPISSVNLLGRDNIFSGNNPDRIEIPGAWIASGELTFKDVGIPYFINGRTDVYARNDYSIRINVEPGVEMRFSNGSLLSFRPGNAYQPKLYEPELKAIGTAEKPIKFTSNEANPAPGDWDGIQFQFFQNNANSEMDYCIVEYGGTNGGNINLHGWAGLKLSHSILRKSSNNGVYQYSSGTLTITDSEIRDNDKYGLYLSSATSNISNSVIKENYEGGIYSSSSPTINHNYIYNNANYGINNVSVSIINAKNNWWGDVTGPLDDNDDRKTGGWYNPYGQGNKVTSYVDYSEWREPVRNLRDNQLWTKGESQ